MLVLWFPHIWHLHTSQPNSQPFSLLEGSSPESHLTQSPLSFPRCIHCITEPILTPTHCSLPPLQLQFSPQHFSLYGISHYHLLIYCLSPDWSISTMRAGVFSFLWLYLQHLELCLAYHKCLKMDEWTVMKHCFAHLALTGYCSSLLPSRLGSIDSSLMVFPFYCISLACLPEYIVFWSLTSESLVRKRACIFISSHLLANGAKFY